MTTIEKLFCLRAIPPFGLLSEQELALMAEVAKPRSYQPHERIALAGAVLQTLFITLSGEIMANRSMPPIFGPPSLLFDRPLQTDLVAGPDGAQCLLIAKSHFFTLVTECPAWLLGFLDAPALQDPSIA